MKFTYIFGPVYSGRLGHSLGLDLLGKRICSMDCLYCEVGKTEELTLTRKPYVPAKDLLDELRQWRDEHCDNLPDYVTLGGSGEPCLNSELDIIIKGCKQILPSVPVAVLTNSTLLCDSEVQEALMEADAVLPSLDSLVDKEFTKLNRPCGGVIVAQLAECLVQFSKKYSGKIFLEILLSQGINDSQENLTLLKEYVTKLQPHRVDVTTLSRPGAFSLAKAVDPDVRKVWQNALSECITRFDANGSASPQHASQKNAPPATVLQSATGEFADLPEQNWSAVKQCVLESLKRRPQTPSQLAVALTLPLSNVQRALDTLEHEGDIYKSEPDRTAALNTDEPFYSCQ
ncbi:radical SAM protein [Halodesulfovibrio aestuarii]|uniref:Wyosine [tRNA(Phe)-imidazoG37] synthetase, radical SAM superfamily n=1 Tax=Halodesulfovibrio aestuarii TaxID=126333 RepID=A0A8G2FBU4_9BACT|nr:radical SAM protein [Halodesulfovibrio aestuarii]SHJ54249.1 Wyosine [tRNA(Phe)-imidazoG37] synthetase, radical SAM superfamily [Halodesulfovibrio aestuarii]